MSHPNDITKPSFFVPTEAECRKIFPNIKLNEWKYGVVHGEYDGTDVFILGISKTNTAFAAAHIFESFDIDYACLIGIAGTYRSSGLKPGDVVCVNQDYFVDEGMLVGDAHSLTSEMGFPVCPENRVQYETVEGIPGVDANTVSWLSSSDDLAAQYHLKTGAAIESMEGAAFGLVADKMGIRCSQIRGISNYCGARDQQEWNIKAAFSSLQRWVIDFTA